MLKNYIDFILEKKDTKADKMDIKEKILKLFKEKPEIKASSEIWPDAKNIYGLSDIKRYVDGDNVKVDGAFHDLMKEDDKIKSISVKIKHYSQSYPYFYHADHTSKEEAQECKDKMEKSQKPVEKKPAKNIITRKPPVKKATETTEKKPVAEKGKVKATVKRKT